MTRIGQQYYYFGFIITFLLLLPYDTVMALGFENKNLIYEQQSLVRRPTSKLGQRNGFIFGLGAGVGNVNFGRTTCGVLG